MRLRAAASALVPLTFVIAACSSSDDTASGSTAGSTVPETSDSAAPRPTDDQLTLSGGDATVFVEGSTAFSQSVPGLNREDHRAFAVGNNFFNDNWVTAPASTVGRDGLGPLFNAQSCSSCHLFDGRAAPPTSNEDPERGLLLRLSIMGPDGVPLPEPSYGDQLQDRAITDAPAEGRIVIDYAEVPGAFADGTTYSLLKPTYSIADLAYGPMAENVMISPRIAPAMFGVGLLEAVAEATVLAGADPDDVDGDGISGRPNMIIGADGTAVLGRFGWKANVPTVNDQNAGAFLGDIGITTPVRTDENCTTVQGQCQQAINGGTPEVDELKLDRVTFYTRTLAVPARREVGAADTTAGEALFAQAGCVSCHSPQLVTGESDIAQLSEQTIRPYTDLLIHDMGEGLADGRPDQSATGTEWRTAPLWGIGLVDDVSGHSRFLHDGRARNLEEAILWHGGEAAASQRQFVAMTAEQRRQLLIFLESL